MNRKEITKFLSELLVEKRLSGMGKYYASEVTMDWYIGKITHTMRRVDFIQFVPKNQTVSGIEHGDFYFYEVKSCKEDYNSGNGLTFEGDKNYIVTTAETYKKIIKDVDYDVGVLIACPVLREIKDEIENPTQIDGNIDDWILKIAKKHIVPHVLPQFIVGLVLLFPHAILHESSITFLDFGLSTEQPAIGVILSESMRYLIMGKWWLAVFPGMMLVLTVVLFEKGGTALRQLLDPGSVHK